MKAKKSLVYMLHQGVKTCKKVVDKLQQLPIELTYVEGKGAHDWDFWDPQLKAIFEWLKVRKTFVSE